MRAFQKISMNTATAPDYISRRTLGYSVELLRGVFHLLLKCNMKVMNELCPVALTCLAMNAMESVIKNHIITEEGSQMDPLQFAYSTGRGLTISRLSP